MLRHRGHRPESTTLTAGERRRFRQVQRGLRAGDPQWFALHCPQRTRQLRLARYALAGLSFTLLVGGAMTGLMPVVLCGVVLAVAATTSHVSTRSRRLRP
jgi:hypothetical protein